ncbi:MAG: DUF4836 family protein [Bacteroidetes bacterium]|nr:DUF4836 family protein [Bacteroidota bacterium]
MKQIKKLALVMGVFVLLFSACQDDVFVPKDALGNIPEDVSAVSSINLTQLMEKADFEAVKQMEFFQDALLKAERTSPALAKIMADPALSGIDLEKNLYVTSDINPKNPEEVFVASIFSIKDKAAFEALLKNADQEVVFEDHEGFQTITKYNQQIVAWNGEVGIFGGSNVNNIDLLDKARKIFETDASTSVVNNKNLRKAISGNHDMTSWFSTDPIASNPQAGMALTFLDIDKNALKDNHIHSTMDFEDGVIAGHSDFFISDGLGKNLLGRFFKDEVTTDFSKYIPTENLISATTAAMDIRGIDAFLTERPQARDMLVFMAKDAGLEMKDIIAAFGGDMLMAAYSEPKENIKLEEGSALFSMSIKNQGAMQKILDLAIESNALLELEKDVYKIMTVGIPGGMSFSQGGGFGQLLIKDDLLFVSNDDNLLNNIKTGDIKKSNRVSKKLDNLIEDNTVASFFDINILQEIASEMKGIQVDDMQFNVNGKGADFKLNLDEKNKNSLKAIFEMINEEYKKDQEKGMQNL